MEFLRPLIREWCDSWPIASCTFIGEPFGLAHQNLTMAITNTEHIDVQHNQLQVQIKDTRLAVSDVKNQNDMNQVLVQSNSSLFDEILSILNLVRLYSFQTATPALADRERLCRDIAAQLSILVDLAHKVWESNLQMVHTVIKHQTSPCSPDLRYTWFQEPIRFEDAVGRIIPIPSEYNWSVGEERMSNCNWVLNINRSLKLSS